MPIRSRKHPVARLSNHAEACTVSLVLAAMPGLALSAEPQADAAADSTDRVLRSVVVAEEVGDEGYRADSVSSPKFTQPLLDTPQSVVVIRKELLDDQGLGSLSEALRNTPGITFTLGENGNTMAGDSMTMRGFDVSGSIFVDGVRDLGAVSRDTFNTEQVEVVKGAAGSDIGRATPTGYINMASKQPTLVAAVASKLAIGTANRVRAEGDLNQTLGGWEGAAVRLNMMYDRGDIPGRNIADRTRWGFAPSLALGLGGATRAYFNYLFVKQINTPDGGLPTIGLEGYYFPPVATPADATQPQADAVAALNLALAPLLADAPAVDPDNFYGAADDFEHVRANQFTFRVEHDLSAATTLRNTSRYGRQSMRRMLTGVNTIGNLFTGTATSGTAAVNPDSSTWTVSRARQRRDEVNEVLTNQSNLTTAFNTGAIGHSLSTGVEFIYERQQNLGMTNPGTNAAANLYNPSTADTFLDPLPSGAYNDGKTLTAAVYVFDTLQLTEQFSVNAGLRFDRYRTEYAAVPAPAATPTASVYAEADGELFTGKLGLVYKPVENGSIYAVVANSELPPGGSSTSLNNGANNMFVLVPGTATNINNPNLDPQKARNLEVGTKWDLLGNRLILTAAAFDTRNENDIAEVIAGEVEQRGERKVRGFELGAAGLITPDWQVSAGFASMDTEVVEGTAATEGAQLQYSPKITFTSWTTYTFPFGLQLGGGARYTSSQFRNGNATQAAQFNLATNPSAWVFDAMAGYDVSDSISVQLNVQNITDKFHFASINNSGTRYIRATPRTILLSGTVQFY